MRMRLFPVLLLLLLAGACSHVTKVSYSNGQKRVERIRNGHSNGFGYKRTGVIRCTDSATGRKIETIRYEQRVSCRAMYRKYNTVHYDSAGKRTGITRASRPPKTTLDTTQQGTQ